MLNVLRDQRGAEMIEYVVVVAILLFVLALALVLVFNKIQEKLNAVNSSL